MAATGDRIRERLSSARRALLLGVGGGNDAVSTLLMKSQLARDYGFAPEVADIAAVLPDVLEYVDVLPTTHPQAIRITPETRRVLYGTPLWKFPEPLLAESKGRFGVTEVFGVKMNGGPIGMADALESLATERGYDLLLALDVGGDFVAVPENLAVLSPMMDAWSLMALRELSTRRSDPAMLFGLFGLGTDAESTPEMLRAALGRLRDRREGRFDWPTVRDAADFYRTVIEPNRASNTASRTIRHIEGVGAETSVTHHVRFGVNVGRTRLATYRQEFEHPLDPTYAGVYVLFEDLSPVENPFAIPCRNGVEWFCKVRRLGHGLSHELNGYGYDDLAAKIGAPAGDRPFRLYFGTPPYRFSAEKRARIAADVVDAVRTGFHDIALIDADDLGDQTMVGLLRTPAPLGLVIVARVEAESLVHHLWECMAEWAN